jgi:hypothetical protein
MKTNCPFCGRVVFTNSPNEIDKVCDFCIAIRARGDN